MISPYALYPLFYMLLNVQISLCNEERKKQLQEMQEEINQIQKKLDQIQKKLDLIDKK